MYISCLHCPSFMLLCPFQRVSEVSNHWWYSMLILPPLLKDSVAAPLLSAYYPDCVGMSPSCTSTHRAASNASPGKLEHSTAVPSVLGESWSWHSLDMCGWAERKLFLMCAPCDIKHLIISWIWLYCGSVICFMCIVQLIFPSIIWKTCNTCPGIMSLEFNEYLFEIG